MATGFGRFTRPVTALALVTMLALSPFAHTANADSTTTISILNVSDWHAQLDPVRGNGGAAVLSAYFQEERAANPNTLTLTAGDAFGASPPLASFFDEEPGVRAMNLMGFDADTLGNHNFDKGLDHLQRMIDLADFPFVSANLEHVEDNLDGVEPFVIRSVDGVDVAIIGITNPEAPTLVFPGNFGTIEVTDPVQAAMDARAAAAAAGADVFIVITHMGVTGRDHSGAFAGPLVDFAEGVSGFDLILGDHTDAQFEAVINGALVTENPSKGVSYSRVDLVFDASESRVVSREVTFVTPVADAVTPDAHIEAMLQPYRDALAAVFDEKIGEASDEFPRGGGIERVGEVAIGNLVADALRERYGTDLAFTNGGGIRTPLPSAYAPADTTLRRTSDGYATGPNYDLVVGDVYATLPFGNIVVTRTVTGAELYDVLENGVSAMPGASGRFAQVSGFSFTFDSSRPAGERVVSVTWHPEGPPATVKHTIRTACPDATPVQVCRNELAVTAQPAVPILDNDAQSFTLATNDFVNAGGDGYVTLADGEGTTREVMADVLLAYIRDAGVIEPVIDGRIQDLAQPGSSKA